MIERLKSLPRTVWLLGLISLVNDVVLSRVPGGGDAALGAAYAIAFETLLVWLCLSVLVVACGAIVESLADVTRKDPRFR